MTKTTTPTSTRIAQLSIDTTTLQTIRNDAQHSSTLQHWTSQTINIAQALSNRLLELANAPDLSPSDIGKLATANKAIYELGQQLQASRTVVQTWDNNAPWQNIDFTDIGSQLQPLC